MSNEIRIPVKLFGCPVIGVYLLETYNGFFALFSDGIWIGSIRNKEDALSFFVDWISA